jgi:hypothetical protein
VKRFSTLLILSTLVSVAAFAAESGSGKIHLTNSAKVGSTELPAGDYKVTWSGSGDKAHVTLTQGKNVATATARVEAAHQNNDSVTVTSQNGDRILDEIQVHGTTLVLQNGQSNGAGL